MWSKLKAAFPHRFFHGCVSHGLHLFVQDIFAPRGNKNNHPNDQQRLSRQQQQPHEHAQQEDEAQSTGPQYPDGYPFDELATLVDTCKRIVSVVTQDEASVQLLARTLLPAFSSDWRSLRSAFQSLLAAHTTLRSIVSARTFLSRPSQSLAGASTMSTVSPSEAPAALDDANHSDALRVHHVPDLPETRARVQQVVLSSSFVPLLEKAVAILEPIAHFMGVFEREHVSCSEVFFAFAKALPDAFVRLPGLSKAERAYLLALNQTRFNFLYGDAHGIAYLLDPRYIGEGLNADVRKNIEDVIFDLPLSVLDRSGGEGGGGASGGARAGMSSSSGGGPTQGPSDAGGDDDDDERKMEIAQQLTEFVIDATREKNSQSFRYTLLRKKKKSALQYWLTDGQRWPLLQRVACEVLSLPSSTLVAQQRVASASASVGAVPAELQASLSSTALAKLLYVRVNNSSSSSSSSTSSISHDSVSGGK